MTEDILSAYRSVIKASALLSESDRAACLAKLDRITVNIGCPGEAYHSSAEISGSLPDSPFGYRESRTYYQPL